MYTARIKRPNEEWSSAIYNDFFTEKDIKRFLRVSDWDMQVEVDNEFVEIDNEFLITHHRV